MTANVRALRSRLYPADGYDTVVGRTVTDASGKVIHQDAFRSHYSKVDGLLRIGTPD